MTNPQPIPAEAAPVRIRRCTTDADFRRCVELQQAVWNFDPIEVVSSHIMAVAVETGGQVLGAFDGVHMIGFAQAFGAIREGKPYLHSHMVAVLPDYQGRGIGRMLKLAQREDALARGIDRIEWTFDPLEIRNAYFNVVRLGAIMRRYLPDFYGSSSSPLHANLPTDRLVAEWRLNSPRVRACVSGVRQQEQPDAAATISLPRNMSDLRRDKPARAAEIQANLSARFVELFGRGYAVLGFGLTKDEGVYQLAGSYED